jgi:hypothetical protein
MRIRLDIPDKIPYKLVKKAHQEGMTVNNLVLRSIQAMLKNEARPAEVRRPPGNRIRKPRIFAPR